MASNRYGIQNTTVRKVTVNPWQDAANAGTVGAQIGSNFGPEGTLIGAGVGALYGGAMGMENKKRQTLQAEQDTQANLGIKGLEGLDPTQQYMTPKQARYGMYSKGVVKAEIEGDGTGSKNGGGEIVTDKHYNIKKVASGAPTHENGGTKVTLTKGDIVFPTQDKEDQNKIMSAIQSLKARRDSRAKAFLDKTRDSLPTDEDYDDGKFPDGINTNYDTFNKGKFQTKDLQGGAHYYRNPTTGKIVMNRLKGPNAGNKVELTRDEERELDRLHFGNSIYGPKGSSPDKFFQGKNHMFRKQGDEYHYKEASNDWVPAREDQLTAIEPHTKWGYKTKIDPHEAEFQQEARTSIDNSPSPGETMSYEEKVKAIDYNPTSISSGGINPSQDTATKGRVNVQKTADTLINVGRYANVAHNFIEGSKPSETVNRRQITADNLRYQDLSSNQRNAVLENRNYMTQASGNNVNSAVSQGRQASIGAQAMNQMEDVNAREAGRYSETVNQNTMMQNQVRAQNLSLQNQYDEQDAQNRAASQAYKDTAMSETSRLADIETQTKYMKSKDNKEYEMDKERLKAIGSENYGREQYEDMADLDKNGKPKVKTRGYKTVRKQRYYIED